MSLILEALKKIETDKSRNLQEANIASAILQPDRKAKRKSVLLISCLSLSAAVLLIAAGAGISYLLSAKGQDQKPSAAVQSNLPPKAAISTPPSAATPERTVSAMERPLKPSAAAQPELIPKTGASTSASMAASERPAEAAPGSFKSAHSEASPPLVKELPAKRVIRHRPEKIQPVDASTAPKRTRTAPDRVYVSEEIPPIRINGVIWSEESNARRALVNGSAVKEGDSVDGVRVERIEPNHIRFSKNGKPFNVPIK